jgi:hypothetical protein
MKKLFVIFFVLFSGCYYGGSTVECESLLDNSKYMCEIDTKNADICFDVIFSDGKVENKCVEDDNNSQNFLLEFSTKNRTPVVNTKIVEETYSSDTIYLFIGLTSFLWFMSVVVSFVVVFGDNNYDKRNRYTITLLFVCLFHFIGLGILYLIDTTKDEMKDRKKL